MSNYAIAVLVGWVIAAWMLCSVLFSDSGKFSDLGRSKGRWSLIAVTAFVPYFGIIAVLFYLFKVRVHFPPRPKQPSRPRPASGGANTGYPGNSGRGPSSPPSSPSWTPPQKTRCGVCNGGFNPCNGCSNGYVYGTRTELHAPCSGSGRVKCAMCNGSGYR
jgi:hypothetical protein